MSNRFDFKRTLTDPKPAPCPNCLHAHKQGEECGTVDLGGGFSQWCYCKETTAAPPREDR